MLKVSSHVPKLNVNESVRFISHKKCHWLNKQRQKQHKHSTKSFKNMNNEPYNIHFSEVELFENLTTQFLTRKLYHKNEP